MPGQFGIGIDAADQLGIDLGDLPVDLTFPRLKPADDDPVAPCVQPVPAGDAILDQSHARDMQFPDFEHAPAANRRRLWRQGRSHMRAHPGVDAVGLGGVAAGPRGIDLDRPVSRLRERRLEIAMKATRRGLADADRRAPEPLAERLEPVPVVRKPHVPAVGKATDFGTGFGNVHTDGFIHYFFLLSTKQSALGSSARSYYVREIRTK